MDIFENILTKQFFDKNSSGFFDSSKAEFADLTSVEQDRLSFWHEISNLFSEKEFVNINDFNSFLTNESKLKSKDYDWKLEKNFLTEVKLSIQLNQRCGLFERFFNHKALSSLQSIIDFYDGKGIFTRKHQSQFLLAKYYSRYHKEKLAYLTLVKLYRSIADNQSQYLDSWILYFFNKYFTFCSINLLYLLIDLSPEIGKNKEITTFVTIYLKNQDSFLEKFSELFQLIAFFDIDPAILRINLSKYIKSESDDNSYFFNFVNFILSPEISSKYKTIDYIVNHMDFFSSLILDPTNSISFFDIIKRHKEVSNEYLLGPIFQNRNNISIKKRIDFIFAMITDPSELIGHKDKFEQLILSIEPEKFNFSIFQNIFPIINLLKFSDNFMIKIYNYLKSFIESGKFSNEELNVFFEKFSIKDFKYLFSNENIKSALLNTLQERSSEFNQLSFSLKLKISFLTGFSLFEHSEDFEKFGTQIIENNLTFNMDLNERIALVSIIDQINDYFEFFCQDLSIFHRITEIREILSVLNASTKGNSFDTTLFFEGFSRIFAQKSALNYLWTISIFGFQQLLGKNQIYDTKAVIDYFNTISSLPKEVELSNSELASEIKQLSLELIKSYSLKTKDVFNQSINTISKKVSDQEAIFRTLIRDILGNELFIYKSIGILHGMNELLYSSSNFPIKLYSYNQKVFSKIHYLCLFDILSNIILKYSNLSLDDIHEVVKTKLLLLRALGHLAGRAHSKALLRAVLLMKNYQKEYHVSDSDCIHIINSTPWKYSDLENKLIEDRDYSDITLFFGISRDNDPLSTYSAAMPTHALDIGLGRYLFLYNEDQFMEEISKNTKLLT